MANHDALSPSAPQPIPAPGKWLGALGLVPFAGLALGALLFEGSARDQALFALAAYGAAILSFLGGIHWGLAIAGFGNDATWRRLIVSVIPALAAWCALLLSPIAALLLLAASFALLLLVDLQATQQAEAPAWYPKLRWPLTAVVVGCLLLGAILAGGA